MRRDPGRADPSDRIRFTHMLDAARQAVTFVKHRSRGDLDSDDMLRRALISAIQEIGEAASRTSPEGRARAAGVPWSEIVRMRNIVVHIYWGVNLDRVWSTATDDLPPFIAAIESALASWPETTA